MTPEHLDKELSREPFIPLRLHLSDGRSVDIGNPGLVWIVKLSLFVARAVRLNSRMAEDYDLISLRHIVRLEMLAPADQA